MTAFYRMAQLFFCLVFPTALEMRWTSPETATGGVLPKKKFLKISEISRENPSVGVSF